jgi:hypothetical protein
LVRTSQGKLDEIQNSSSLQIKIVWRKLALAEYHACQGKFFIVDKSESSNIVSRIFERWHSLDQFL